MNNKQIFKKVRSAQKSEITEHYIYQKLSKCTRDEHNKEILLRISGEEIRHYHLWQEYTKQVQKPNWVKVWTYYFISRIFGLTFGIKLMERGEGRAQALYRELSPSMPNALQIAEEEQVHEDKLIQMIDEERLNYIGSMIRGLNDALVELTGALAGFTFALQDSRLIAMTGLITGIAAAMSMGGTEYLATKSSGENRSPLKSSLYTGIAYIFTVLFLVFPYLLFSNIYMALGIMIFDAVVIIMVFNFYLSVAKDLSFWKKFLEMVLLSLGITVVSFIIGLIVRHFLGVEV